MYISAIQRKKAFMYKKRILAQFLFLWDVLQLMTKQFVCFCYWNSAGAVKNMPTCTPHYVPSWYHGVGTK